MDHHPICRWSAVLCLGLGSAGLFGCAGDSDASAVQRTDSAGVEIVLSGSTDRVLEWQFRRLFELGGADDGPESFYRVAPLLVGADSAGNLYVLDSPNARVVVFDAEGRFLRSMGSRGGGPGEFRSPATISVSSDGEVAVFDYAKGDLVRFAADGTVLVDETITTMANGFLELWLPRNQEVRLSVQALGRSAHGLITTYGTSNTCVTTLQLL